MAVRAVGFASVLGTRSETPQYVRGVVDGFQVGRVNARWHSAQMVDFGVERSFPVCKSIRHAVSAETMGAYIELPVTIAVRLSRP